MRVGTTVAEEVNVGAGQADGEHAGLAAFVFEMGVLKRVRRAGWWHVGVRDPESVSEHSLRVAQLAGLIAAEEGVDPARAAYMAIWHDSQETRVGDIPHSAKPYMTKPDNEAITADQVANMPESSARSIQEAVHEFESQSTAEARCARDADKLECLFQALEYRDLGVERVQGWVDSSMKALGTKTAQRIAEAALVTSPLAWRGR
jgi:5'-deoxynucleotidase YfbR-like HD superfamily hydrolase